ncbi:hypothetical protein ACOMHN_053602 [Nucella lapillus]
MICFLFAKDKTSRAVLNALEFGQDKELALHLRGQGPQREMTRRDTISGAGRVVSLGGHPGLGKEAGGGS